MNVINHVEEARKTLLQQYESKHYLNTLIDAIVEQLQSLENASHEVLEQRFIMTARGVQLDKLGELIGIGRGYRTDYEYRRLLAAMSVINRGGGTPENIIAAIKIVYNPFFVTYEEPEVATFSIFTVRELPMVGVIQLLKTRKPLGVRLVVSFSRRLNFFVFAEITIVPDDYKINDSDYYYVNNSAITLVVRAGQTLRRDGKRFFAEKNESGIVYEGKNFIEGYSNE